MKKLLFSLILSLLPIASSAIQYEYFNPLMKSNAAVKVNETVGVLTPPEGKGFGVLSALTNLQSVNSSIATNEYGIQVDTLGMVCPTEDAVAAAISAHNTDQSAHSYIQNRITVNDNAIAANADAIQKTRNDFIEADSEIHQILNNHAGELTTLRNDLDDLGDEVAVIEGKIPASTTSSNQLVNASQLAAEEQDIRDDMNQSDSELQTQITAQAGAITTLRNDVDDLGDEVAGIEGKIPSGASTSNLLATNSQINTLTNRISAEETSRQNADTLLQASINSGLALKLDKAQGVENNGKILTVGADGQITLSSAPGSGLLSVNHDSTLTGAGTDVSPLGIASSVLSELNDKADQAVVNALSGIVSSIQTDYVSKTTQNAQTIASSLQAPELTVSTSQGTLNMSITAGVATIATNNGLDIISQTKFDTLPTTDDTTTWANALDANLVSKAQVASALSELPTGANLPILMSVWADHLLNDMSWLRADTFSWQSGDVYVAAYNHLANDYQPTPYINVIGDYYIRSPRKDTFINDEFCYAWELDFDRSVVIYTKTETPTSGDRTYYPDGSNFEGSVSSSSTMWDTKQDVIEGLTINYILAQDGHKICLPDQESVIQELYSQIGVANYYILDTASERFKLPRKYKPKRELVKSYKNGSEWYNLYSDGWVEQGGLHNRSYGSTVNLLIRMSDSEYDLQLTVADIQRYANAYSRTDTAFAFTTADDSSANNDGNVMWIVSGYANDSELINIIDQQFEYYYVGNFEQSAIEQTAGLSAELFNGKADVSLNNIPANYDYVVETQLPTASNGYTWYRKYKSGWVEQGGTSSSGVTVTLPVVMVDNSYTLVFGNDWYSENVGTAIIVYGLKTASSFLAQGRWNGGGTGGIGFSWHVSGMSAQ